MHDNDPIIFQLSAHFLPRVALSIERLLIVLHQAVNETHAIIHHYALNSLFELLKLIEKPELKSRFLKEFMRIEHGLLKSHLQLSNQTFARLFVQIQILSHLSGRFGEPLLSDPFLHSIRMNQPSYHGEGEIPLEVLIWLEKETSFRQEHLSQWVSQLKILKETIETYLALFRETAEYQYIQLHHGFYQCPLSIKTSGATLISLKVPKNKLIFPKIQIGHHGLSIRIVPFEQTDDLNEYMTLELAIGQI